MMKRILVLLLVALMAAPVAGCGRKGNPERPEGSQFPRQYPTQ
jgi:predicted small lipoprotein YifL